MLPLPNEPTFLSCNGGLDLVTRLKYTTSNASLPVSAPQGLSNEPHTRSELANPSHRALNDPARHTCMESPGYPPTLIPTFSFPYLAIGSIPPPPPDVLLAAMSYGRAATAMINANTMQSCSTACWPSGGSQPHASTRTSSSVKSNEKTPFADMWLRLLTQRLSFTNQQNYETNKSHAQMQENTFDTSARTSGGELGANEQQLSLNYSKMNCIGGGGVSGGGEKNASEFDLIKNTTRRGQSKPDLVTDPRIQIHRVPESGDVKVICKQVIELGHLFGPIPMDDNGLLDHAMVTGKTESMEKEKKSAGIDLCSSTGLPFSWTTFLRGTLNESGERSPVPIASNQFRANLLPVLCTPEQLALIYNPGRAAPSLPVSCRQGLLYFKAIRRILPGEELIVEGHNPLNARRILTPRNSVGVSQRLDCSTTKPQHFESNFLDQSVHTPSFEHNQTGAHFSTVLRRLFSIITQNTINNNVPSPQMNPRPLRETPQLPVNVPFSIAGALGHKVIPANWPHQTTTAVTTATTPTTKAATSSGVPLGEQRSQQPYQQIRRNQKQNTFTSHQNADQQGLDHMVASFCYDTGANQLRAAHAMEPEEAGEGYSCEYCGKMFAYQYYRDKHLKYTRCVDQGNRKYPCKLCSRSFEKRDRLRIHVLHVHEKRRPHKCHLCEKSFSQSSSLNKHLRVHSGERPYKCCYCNKAFTASSILRTHIRQHSGEKPFKCKFCWKPFASHAAHDSHVRRTHAELVKPASNAVANGKEKTGGHDNRTWADAMWMKNGHLQEDTQPSAEVDASTSSNESLPFILR